MPSRALLALAALLYALLAAVIVRYAWLGDDAYITLRTVENLLAGHGAVWNPGERAQTYTHPLWMLLLALGRWLSGEAYFTTIGISLALSLTAAAALLWRGGMAAAASVAALLIASRSFVEFATSGLETPLVFVLLVAFVAVVTGEQEPHRRLFLASLLAALLATTRMDLIVLVAPGVLAAARGLTKTAALRGMTLGMLPFAAWLAFAAFYYGTPFPVTAYAKALHVGIPAGELFEQGLYYVRYVATHDPAMLFVVVLGAGLGLACAPLRSRLLATGVLLYCVYVIKVGGDFMAGRFFTPPFVVALAIVAAWLRTTSLRVREVVPLAALLLLFVPGLPGWLRKPATDKAPTEHYRGIIDERSFYYWNQGLLSPTRDIPVWGTFTAMLKQMGRTTPITVPWGFVGRYGYTAGDLVYICDSWLCDPLLMRLPAHPLMMQPTDKALKWRIGHFIRRIPEGYLETLARGENVIHHPGLRRYYDALRVVLRAPLFSRERLSAMAELWSGKLDAGLASFVAEDYLTPPRLPIVASELSPSLPAGTLWFDAPRVRLVYHGGVELRLDGPQRASALQVMLQAGTSYEFHFRRGNQDVGSVALDDTATNTVLGLRLHTIAVPTTVGEFDTLWLDAKTNAEKVAAIGGLQFVP